MSVPVQSGFVLDADFLGCLKNRLVVPEAVAVVGAGRWAKVMCRVLANFTPPVGRIVLVAERNYESTREWIDERQQEEENGWRRVAVCPSIGHLLQLERVDAAVVTKMASEHHAAARQLLLAGKHVLVEKPFVLAPDEARELIALARAQRRTLAVGYEFMFARTLHHFRETVARHLLDVSAVEFVWDDTRNAVKWGLPKAPDLSANIVTDLYPHILSQLEMLFGRRDVALRRVESRDGCSDVRIELEYGTIDVRVSLDKAAAESRRLIVVESSRAQRLRLDYTSEPGHVDLDGVVLPSDRLMHRFPASLTSEIAYFFAQIERPEMTIPNTAEETVHFVDATARANLELGRRQTQEVRSWLWKDLPATTPDSVRRILGHHLFDGLLRHGLVANPKDTEAVDRWASRAFRVIHRFSRDPWTEQADVLAQEGLDKAGLVRFNAALRDSDFVQRLIAREGVARQYWSTILPLSETNALAAVLANRYQFPLRLGIYAAVSCMFYCSFCGRMENPEARYAHGDVVPGNALFDQIFEAMPRGVSTLSLGGGLEPLTNPRLDDVIRSAKRYGHKVPLVTNGYMLTPNYVRRHDGLWDVDVLRISLYGVDEDSYYQVTKKRGAFSIVKNNVIEFLKERRRRQSGPRVGFNFIVLVNTTGEVLRLVDLIAEINEAVGGPGIDFLTLREDFSRREGDGLTAEERCALVEIFCEFNQRRARLCPSLNVDFGYALYPLSEATVWPGLAMVGDDRMLPKAYPQVSVALDLLGDVYLYRDAVFPGRPGADRYKIGTVTTTRSLEAIVRDFLAKGREIAPRPNDTWLMDAFDHVVTNLVWQAQSDERIGIPFRLGPVRRCMEDEPRAQPVAVNYWQGLYGA